MLAAIVALTVMALIVWPRDSAADPCAAELPTQAGAEFGGVVRHVIDGDSVCIGPAAGGGATWIEVRLMDFDAPEHDGPGDADAERTLRRLVLDREARCVATPSSRSGRTYSWDRKHAVCRIGGRTIGGLMRAAIVAEAKRS
jgi:endonuclease YncB( thermonuclease family)